MSTTNNVMISRTVKGINLDPTGNKQGFCSFTSILTGRKIQGKQFTPLPMPSKVIQIVELLAPKIGMRKKDITFQDRNKELIAQKWGSF